MDASFLAIGILEQRIKDSMNLGYGEMVKGINECFSKILNSVISNAESLETCLKNETVRLKQEISLQNGNSSAMKIYFQQKAFLLPRYLDSIAISIRFFLVKIGNMTIGLLKYWKITYNQTD